MEDRHAFKDAGTVKVSDFPDKAKPKKGPLDEEMVEDAATRQEQTAEEVERWQNDE